MTEKQDKTILRLTQEDGSVQDITMEQLALMNHVNFQALITLLFKKGIIGQEELLEEINRLHKGRFEKQ